jgi:ABC-type transporter Mla subunit MlaD
MPVKLKGFPVGYVTSIEPKLRTDSREIKVFVSMAIERDYMSMIPVTTKAHLKHESLVGQWSIELVADQNEARAAANGDILLFERPRSIEDVGRDVQERVASAFEQVSGVVGQLQPEIKKVGPLLQETREFVAEMKETSHAARDMAKSASVSANDIAQSTKGALTAAATTMNTVNENLPRMFEESKLLSEELRRTVVSGRKAVEHGGKVLDSAQDAVDATSEIAAGARRMWPFSLMVKPPAVVPMPFDSQDGLGDLSPSKEDRH